MSRPPSPDVRVLALDPSKRGFGFVVFEGPERLIDWGAACVVGDKNAGSLQRIAALIRRYDPEVLVIEDFRCRACRRRDRVVQLLRSVSRLATTHRIPVHRGTLRSVGVAFAGLGVSSKYAIAAALAGRYPELAPLLPPKRKPWMGEDDRLRVFDVAAMGLAYYDVLEQRSREA